MLVCCNMYKSGDTQLAILYHKFKQSHKKILHHQMKYRIIDKNEIGSCKNCTNACESVGILYSHGNTMCVLVVQKRKRMQTFGTCYAYVFV